MRSRIFHAKNLNIKSLLSATMGFITRRADILPQYVTGKKTIAELKRMCFFLFLRKNSLALDRCILFYNDMIIYLTFRKAPIKLYILNQLIAETKVRSSACFPNTACGFSSTSIESYQQMELGQRERDSLARAV